jgi:hypothetical protein
MVTGKTQSKTQGKRKSVPHMGQGKTTKVTAKGLRKRCPGCRKWKDPLTEFGKSKTGVLGRGTYCVPCKRKRDRKFMVKHPQPKETRKQYALVSLRRRYGVTTAWVKAQVAAQGGCCGRCHVPFKDSKDTHLDHDHACCPGGRSCGSCVRGVICFTCNHQLSVKYCKAHPKDVYLLAYSTRRAMVEEFVGKFTQHTRRAA